jgi:cytochrome c biogenesis protein CcmG, thiol:disulfide interchange protein DsbE
MRFPIVIGFLAALVIGILAVAGLLSMIGDEPALAPTPRAPTVAPLETATPPVQASPNPSPDATASPQAGASPSGLFTQPPEGLGIGQRAPRIQVDQLGGGTLDTRRYRGKPLWINFMATWCPQCRDELPMMEDLQAQLVEEMNIVLIDVGEDPQTVADFIDSLNVDLPTGLDEDGTVQQQWGAYALPVHYWIDGQGVVQSILFGGAPREIFIESIRTVVPEAPIE